MAASYTKQALLLVYAIHATHLVEFYSWWLTFFNLLPECIKYNP